MVELAHISEIDRFFTDAHPQEPLAQALLDAGVRCGSRPPRRPSPPPESAPTPAHAHHRPNRQPSTAHDPNPADMPYQLL